MIWNICNVLASMRHNWIDLYEWQCADVQQRKLPANAEWSIFATNVGPMPLTGIRLAHAVIKADFLIARNYLLPSLGFLLQMDQILEFGSLSNLRFQTGARAGLADVTQSSTVGRLGQGLSLLFAERQGYNFVGHLASDPSVIASLPMMISKRVADFMFEGAAGDRMILESKATFSLADNLCSPVKTTLKNALEEQVIPWMSIIHPSPSKGYAVYSCMRETGNPTGSAIIFVDPPSSKGEFRIELPGDWARRRNYAAWLKVMGAWGAAERLEGLPTLEVGSQARRRTNFRIAKISGREFAIVPSLQRPALFKNMRFAIGMEVAALKAVEAAIDGSTDALLAYEASGATDIDPAIPLSILGDGTIFGVIDGGQIWSSKSFML